jgi:hypothetical protein
MHPPTIHQMLKLMPLVDGVKYHASAGSKFHPEARGGVVTCLRVWSQETMPDDGRPAFADGFAFDTPEDAVESCRRLNASIVDREQRIAAEAERLAESYRTLHDSLWSTGRYGESPLSLEQMRFRVVEAGMAPTVTQAEHVLAKGTRLFGSTIEVNGVVYARLRKDAGNA